MRSRILVIAPVLEAAKANAAKREKDWEDYFAAYIGAAPSKKQ
jgi:hypothetical protein